MVPVTIHTVSFRDAYVHDLEPAAIEMSRLLWPETIAGILHGKDHLQHYISSQATSKNG